MLEDCNLDLQFFTPNSVVFNVRTSGKDIEIHIHMGKYQVMYISMIISDKSIAIQKDEKFLNYIDTLFSELEMKLCSIVGFYEKGQKIEIFLHINFNSIRINFAPFFIYDEDYKSIKGNLSSIVFEKIKKIQSNQLY